MSWLFVTVIALNDVIRYVVVCFFQTTFFCVADPATTGGSRSLLAFGLCVGAFFLCSDSVGWNPYISWGFRHFSDTGFLCVFMQDYAFSC